MTTDLIFLAGDTARARRTDPRTSHIAAEKAGRRAKDTKRAVYAALETAGRPITADRIYDLARQLGHYCTPERVRTVLSENNGGAWVRLDELGQSAHGNPAHLWKLTADE
jgi:hypothetical protein